MNNSCLPIALYSNKCEVLIHSKGQYSTANNCFVVESWIIYRGNKDGVSSLVDMAIKGSTLIDDNNQNQENEKNGGNQKVTLVAIKPFIKPEEVTLISIQHVFL